MLSGQKFLISRAQVSDTGQYKCVAVNVAGEHEREFVVTVHGRLLKGKKGNRLALLWVAGKKIMKFSVNIFIVSGLKNKR